MPKTPSEVLFSYRGAARVGVLNTIWPLVRLDVTNDELTLTDSLFGIVLAKRAFTKAQIKSIERHSGYSAVSFRGTGIRIVHTLDDYPEKVIFWCRPEIVLAGIAATGFMAGVLSSSSGALKQTPRQTRNFPFRWPPIIVLGMIGYSISLYEFITNGHRIPAPGFLQIAALLLISALSLGMLRSPILQSIFLKPGQPVGKVRSALLLVAKITCTMAVFLFLLLITGKLTPQQRAHPKPLLPNGTREARPQTLRALTPRD